jgi:hypothetical protein
MIVFREGEIRISIVLIHEHKIKISFINLLLGEGARLNFEIWNSENSFGSVREPVHTNNGEPRR